MLLKYTPGEQKDTRNQFYSVQFSKRTNVQNCQYNITESPIGNALGCIARNMILKTTTICGRFVLFQLSPMESFKKIMNSERAVNVVEKCCFFC